MDYRKMAITISPPHRREGIEYLYKQDSYVIRRNLNKISDYYILVPEVTLDSRLHYHGVIKIKDWTKYHKQVHKLLHNSIGFIKLDPIKDHVNNLKWICYIYKNYGILKDLMSPIMKQRLKATLYHPCPDLDDVGPWARYLHPTKEEPSMRKAERIHAEETPKSSENERNLALSSPPQTLNLAVEYKGVPINIDDIVRNKKV